MAHVVVFGDAGGYALDGEGAVSNTVCVAANNGAEVGMNSLVVSNVVFSVVEAENDVLWLATLVIYVETCQTGAIWNESRVDARC